MSVSVEGRVDRLARMKKKDADTSTIVEHYRLWADRAISEVLRTLDIGASNKLADELRSGFKSALCIVAMRSVEIAGQYANVAKYIEVMAAKAKSTGCGNCGEQSAIAFQYLKD